MLNLLLVSFCILLSRVNFVRASVHDINHFHHPSFSESSLSGRYFLCWSCDDFYLGFYCEVIVSSAFSSFSVSCLDVSVSSQLKLLQWE